MRRRRLPSWLLFFVAVIAGVQQAVEGANDYPRRIRGSAVDWSRDWEESLNADVMRRVISLIESC